MTPPTERQLVTDLQVKRILIETRYNEGIGGVDDVANALNASLRPVIERREKAIVETAIRKMTDYRDLLAKQDDAFMSERPKLPTVADVLAELSREADQ